MTIIAPHPFGREITPEILIEQFKGLTLWEDRYRQLILLSRRLPALPDGLKKDRIELKGCENKMWLSSQRLDDGTLHFYGDSEGRIVKGLLAVLLTFVEGQTPEQILAADPVEFYQRLGIYQELSASRGSGLEALIKRVQEIARVSIS